MLEQRSVNTIIILNILTCIYKISYIFASTKQKDWSNLIRNMKKLLVFAVTVTGFAFSTSTATAQVASFNSIALHLSNQDVATAAYAEQLTLGETNNAKATLAQPVYASSAKKAVTILNEVAYTKSMSEELSAWVNKELVNEANKSRRKK